MLEPIVMSFVQTDGFTLTETSGYDIKYKGPKNAERVASWFLNKLYSTTHHFDRKLVVRQVMIDPTKAAKEIVRMAYNQLSELGRRPERILVGRKQFYDIASEVDFSNPFYFDIELQEPIKRQADDVWSHYCTRYKVYNVPVQVIPWMDGVLVL